ncbi:transglycosylase SLT domain-containing protein [Marinibactrum halimedae]|uniref:Membrane protein n=1 Tax=Marinibactrum halimedae TaxID=1444977 RepID=A0AA37WQ02_9GAMM|nr:transglycosylase SLT domain-containing protein [Marinibactrum halimedae]MCD9459417.1 transglycosylase SLT domain-containing protein [Marinibactrum halimedae]GLS27516.1 membrane protein [Marinibactrum halimedae]
MKSLVLLFLMVSMLGCVSTPPKHLDNLCHIFDEKDDWYDDAKDASKRWGSPIPTMMAIMHQESRFVAKAKPPRTKILWIFPGPRKSDAYGYAQVKDSTWDWYRKSSGHGWADRDDFDDAIDFIGWYNHISGRKSRIAPSDTYRLYLAYHEGHGGYNRGSYKKKRWLTDVAKKVSARASRYKQQLAGCQKRLESGWWFF